MTCNNQCTTCYQRIACETLKNTRLILQILENQQNQLNSISQVIIIQSEQITNLSNEVSIVNQNVLANKCKYKPKDDKDDKEENEIVETVDTKPMVIKSKDITVIDSDGTPVKKTITQKIKEAFE